MWVLFSRAVSPFWYFLSLSFLAMLLKTGFPGVNIPVQVSNLYLGLPVRRLMVLLSFTSSKGLIQLPSLFRFQLELLPRPSLWSLLWFNKAIQSCCFFTRRFKSALEAIKSLRSAALLSFRQLLELIYLVKLLPITFILLGRALWETQEAK